MDPAQDEALRIGVARVAIRLLWTATVGAAVFADSLISWRDETPEVLDERAAAERLASMPHPLVLRGEEWGDKGMKLTADAPSLDTSPDGHRAHTLDYLGHAGDKPALILAAGKAYRLAPIALHHLARDYRIAAPLGGGGWWPDDGWMSQHNIPHAWLEGCGSVWLFGRQEQQSMRAPVQTGDGWDADALVVV